SIVRENQDRYYEALEMSGSLGESTPFVEFMLEVILSTVLKVGNKVGNTLTDNQVSIMENIKRNSKVSAVKLSEIVGISKRKIEENLAKLKELNMIKRVGGTRGHWEIKE
ncbi:MAG: Fic family protein, partial [Campylobacterota bacterium]|nr:Fic family protein [Campylobacterota bacterium]